MGLRWLTLRILILTVMSTALKEVTRWVPKGETVTLVCDFSLHQTGKPVWKFDGKIIYADEIFPSDTGYSNVIGYSNRASSYLHIDQFASTNSGTYTCKIGGTEVVLIKLSETHIPLLLIELKGDPAPHCILAQRGDMLNFDCKTDIPPKSNGSLHWTKESDFENIINETSVVAEAESNSTTTLTTQMSVTVTDSTSLTCYLKGSFDSHVTINIVSLSNKSCETNESNKIFKVLVTLAIVVPVLGFSLTTYYHSKKAGKRKHHSKMSTADLEGDTVRVKDSEGYLSPCDVLNKEIVLMELLSSGSICEYWKAVEIRKGGNNNIVVRTVSVSDKSRLIDETNIRNVTYRLDELNNHINVVETFRIFEDKEQFFIYQEFLPNGSLLNFLRGQAQNPGQGSHNSESKDNRQIQLLVQFAKDVANGLAFLHTQKMCHPALAATKILLTVHNTCKLFDIWPLENVSHRLYSLLNKKQPPVAWLPSEAIDNNQYNYSSDVWSYGVLLWEIFSYGKTPYEGKTRQDVEEHHKHDVFLPHPRCCPERIYRIMLSAWKYLCEERPSMGEVLEKLNEISIVRLEGNHKYETLHRPLMSR